MATRKISQMPDASELVGNELIEVVQGGQNKKVTTADVAGLAERSSSLGGLGDVSLQSPQLGDSLVYDGIRWRDKKLTATDVEADPEGAAAAAVEAHEQEPDPHNQYARKGQNLADLDDPADARSNLNVLSSGQTASVISGAIDAHEQEADPHPALTARISALELHSARTVSWNSATDTYSGNPGPTLVHELMRRCVVRDDGSVAYYLDPDDSTLKMDGTPADLSGADGQVMVEIPRCYAHFSQRGSVKTWVISAVPLPGYALHPAFMQGGVECSHAYISAYDACVETASGHISGLNLDDMRPLLDGGSVSVATNKLASVSGAYPAVGLSRADFRKLAMRRGPGWHQVDFHLWSLVQLLYLIEYGDFNAQREIGDGNVSVSGGYPPASGSQLDSPHSVAGKSDHLGNSTGAVSSSTRDTAWMSYRGIENFYGNCWTWVDGINIGDWQAYVCDDPELFSDNTEVNYTALGEPMPTDSGYIRDLQLLPFAFLPMLSSGSNSSSHITDYWYSSTNPGWRALLGGGRASGGAHAGPFASRGGASAGGRTRYHGGRLACRKKVIY